MDSAHSKMTIIIINDVRRRSLLQKNTQMSDKEFEKMMMEDEKMKIRKKERAKKREAKRLKKKRTELKKKKEAQLGADALWEVTGGDGNDVSLSLPFFLLILSHLGGGVDRSYESAPFNPLLHESKLKSTYFLLMSRKIAR